MTVETRLTHMSCGNCKFGEEDKADAGQVYCKHSPPAVVLQSVDPPLITSVFPSMRRIGFCWQWTLGNHIN
jgi:hypothetical protein